MCQTLNALKWAFSKSALGLVRSSSLHLSRDSSPLERRANFTAGRRLLSLSDEAAGPRTARRADECSLGQRHRPPNPLTHIQRKLYQNSELKARLTVLMGPLLASYWQPFQPCVIPCNSLKIYWTAKPCCTLRCTATSDAMVLCPLSAPPRILLKVMVYKNMHGPLRVSSRQGVRHDQRYRGQGGSLWGL